MDAWSDFTERERGVGSKFNAYIEWCGVGEEMKVKAFYSLDKGKTWEQVGTDFVTATSMTWDIPSIRKAQQEMSRQGNLVQQVGRRADNVYVRETVCNRRGGDSIPHRRRDLHGNPRLHDNVGIISCH